MANALLLVNYTPFPEYHCPRRGILVPSQGGYQGTHGCQEQGCSMEASPKERRCDEKDPHRFQIYDEWMSSNVGDFTRCS
ncbi:uncharacterized protein [Physcomitrium patens]|uniref:uncharacterized protein n=1 Tax=Physcomitrium patens TaxID=3218 RepID=UPI003CCDD1C4